MSAVSRTPAPASVLSTRLIAVLRATDASEYPPIIDALVAGGVRAIELTLSTAGVIDGFAGLRARWDGTVDLGIGTITDIEQCHDALAVGAAFVVTPTMQLDVVRACVTAGTPVIPGGFTPTELESAWRLGATAVKIFPATLTDSGYIAQLRGPFPDMQAIPSGGVRLDDIAPWLRGGAMAVSLGGPLIQDAFSGGDLTALTVRARRALSLIDQTVEAP